jgi:hypothetical protein
MNDFLCAEDYGADSDTNLNTSNCDNSISESVINREKILSATTCSTLCQGKIVYVLIIVMMHC